MTGILLIVLAAELLAHGIGECQEAGLLPEVVEHLWDLNWLLDDQTALGQFLTALVGYNASPSLLEVLAYLGYLMTVMADPKGQMEAFRRFVAVERELLALLQSKLQADERLLP